MKIYIAGKITGLDLDYAADEFERAEQHLRLVGHEPLNPMKLVDQCSDRSYEDCLLDALRIMILEAEAVYMLDNWRDSIGARIEHFIAEALRRPVFFQPLTHEIPELIADS